MAGATNKRLKITGRLNKVYKTARSSSSTGTLVPVMWRRLRGQRRRCHPVVRPKRPVELASNPASPARWFAGRWRLLLDKVRCGAGCRRRAARRCWDCNAIGASSLARFWPSGHRPRIGVTTPSPSCSRVLIADNAPPALGLHGLAPRPGPAGGCKRCSKAARKV
jgi:hypothetical protein